MPASAMGNLLAIIGAALLVKLGEKFPKANGHGKLIKEDNQQVDRNNERLEDEDRKSQTNVTQIGVGLLISFSFFMIGIICNYFAPKIQAYAFMIILVVIAKITRILPKYYEESAIMFNQVIVKNLTPAVLTGIGIALLNINVLGQALTWQFIVLCLTSVITISTAAGIFGNLFGLYPVESIVTAGMCNNSMGGTDNVAVLSSAKRMELIAFAQMGNRLGGATILIASGFLAQMFS
ncbi:2-hydroxycarboxylate transporter family protein [Staphylococcus saccharolyticus]|uniref:2-hydroxycarboxylate transporter family protein n=1 Tax=Staphylococcus saccharolyticus TaxID=33028 RepID=UPI001E382B09|nr:2-hydroxycarboxylate transporter family protein [Staphylococcus saccharolyticus]